MADSLESIDSLYKIYRGDAGGIKSADMTDEEKKRVALVRERFVYMSQSKSHLESKFALEKQLYEIFEQHLQQGELWNSPYRFPEIFGSIQRKATDLIDNMPEAKIHSTKDSAQNFAIATQACLDHTERMSYAAREKMRVIYDSLFYGTGILYEGYSKIFRTVTPVEGDELYLPSTSRKEVPYYNGMTSERIDPRDFFIDETATVFYDETGIQGARDCIRRKSYPFSTFLERFSDKGFKHIDTIIPIAWGSDPFGRGKIPYEKESREQKTVQKYVIVLEYWNVEMDMVLIVANGIEIYCGANPFKHKRLPFTIYYNYRRDDSVWGISEVELNAPFVFADEEIVNLMILDAKLALQPAIAVSGDIMFNTEENELQPGAQFTARGLNGGKIQDAIMPLRFGGVPGDAMQVRQLIEDKRIVATGDDLRALYANPQQLATQTLAKRESMQKRIKSNIMQNTIESERNRVEMKISNLIQFYAKPYQNIDGKVVYRRIKIEGYDVRQAHDEAKPEFTPQYGAMKYFTLNEESLGAGEDIEVEVVDIQLNEILKKEEMDDILQFLQTNMQLFQINPQLAQGMNIMGFIKQIARKMDLDYDELFPQPGGEEGQDTIDLELDLIMLGETPEIDPDSDSIKALDRYREFMGTDVYKKANKNVHKAMKKLISLTVENVPNSIKNKLNTLRRAKALSSSGQAAMGSPGGILGQGAEQGVPEVPGGALPPGGAPGPEQGAEGITAPGGMAAGG